MGWKIQHQWRSLLSTPLTNVGEGGHTEKQNKDIANYTLNLCLEPVIMIQPLGQA